LGRIAASIHAVPLAASEEMPLRMRHTAWTDFSLWRREGTYASTPLLDEADALIASKRPPEGPSVFVHGDLWQANVMWDGDTCVGVIDWETAGSGHPGVDLGCLRWDAAIQFGAWAPDHISAGWAEAAGRELEEQAYWDAVAALNIPADIGDLLPSFREAGRSDLDAVTVRNRQEAFLRRALDRLG
jgi:aminoglycoside phosphotransferase (APT) family kinase protein